MSIFDIFRLDVKFDVKFEKKKSKRYSMVVFRNILWYPYQAIILARMNT